MRVRARDVTAAFGRTEVLREVELDVPDGSMTAIVGPNGSGKLDAPARDLRRLAPRPWNRPHR